jgi:hypothetical protein
MRYEETRCPTCDSHAPHLHPAVQSGGEVQPCADPFHHVVTPENTRNDPVFDEVRKLRREHDSHAVQDTSCPFCMGHIT